MPPRRCSFAAVASLSLLLLLPLIISVSAHQTAERLSSAPLRLFQEKDRADGERRSINANDRRRKSQHSPSSSLSSEQTCVPSAYNTSSRRLEGKLNVHLVPHTHDDAGWLKTVDQYHYALNQTIQVAGVAVLLDAVVAALAANPDRTFVYGEVAFFSRWWREASDEQRETVRSLVLAGGDEGDEGVEGGDEGGGTLRRRRPRSDDARRGRRRRQLSFVNGGWVQHDEACSHYEDMVDQTSRGHSWLADAFADLSVLPTIGWQIDPFGHSATHADALVAGAGMDAVFFGRADHQDLELRSGSGDLEVVWDGSDGGGGGGRGSSPDAPRPGGVLAGTFASGNYGPPPGFNWDWGQGDDPVVDSTCGGGARSNNVRDKVEAFVSAARALSTTVVGGGGGGASDGSGGGGATATTGDVMMTMGSDFQYANAAVWFRNMDKLIHYVNLDGRVNAFYSSPSDYVAAKSRPAPAAAAAPRRSGGTGAPSASSPSSALAFKLKTDDFFPYADCDSCYWTGYFASRPALKLDVRRSGAELAAAKQLAALDALSSSSALPSLSLFDPSSAPAPAPSPPPPAPTADEWLEALDDLEEAVALGQHHDAVSGTSRQHVAGDYAMRLARGRERAEAMVAGAVARRAAGADSSAVAASGASTGSAAAAGAAGERKEALSRRSRSPPTTPSPSLAISEPRFCRGANASFCDVSVSSSRSGKAFYVLAYNPLASERAVRVRVPVAMPSSATSSSSPPPSPVPRRASLYPRAGGSAWKVVDSADGSAVPSQVVPLSRGARRARDSALAAGAASPKSAGDAHLAFVTPPLPPLGAAAFLVSPVDPGSEGASFSSVLMFERGGEPGAEENRRRHDRPRPPAPRHPEFLLTPTSDPDGPSPGSGGAGRDNSTAALVVDGASLEPKAVATRGSAMPLRAYAAWYNASDGSPPRGSKEGTPGASPSGAYIFRPTPPDAASDARGSGSSSSPSAHPPRPYRRVFRDAVVGPVVAEVRQDFFDPDEQGGAGGGARGGRPRPPNPSGGSATVDVAVWAGSPDVHVSWTVGPLPPSPSGSGGAEVVIAYAAPLETRGEMLTDSNARRLMLRRRDERPTWALNVTEPVAGNFYPVVSIAAVEEGRAARERGGGQKKVDPHPPPVPPPPVPPPPVPPPSPPPPALSSLSVVVDRAQGAASLIDGEVQLLAHRRLFYDDFRGVAEPLNETACGAAPGGSDCAGLVVAGEHVVVAARSGGEAAVARRRAAAEAGRPALVLYADAAVADEGAGDASAAAAPARPLRPSIPPLPPSLHLLTLAPAPRPAPEGALLLRLAHSFGSSENENKSSRRKKTEESGGEEEELDDGDGGDDDDDGGDGDGDDGGDDFTAPASVDLNALIPGVRWKAVLETTVTGVKPLSEIKRVRWSISGPLGGGKRREDGGERREDNASTELRRREGRPSSSPLECSEGCADDDLMVTLGPLQIRTFLVLPESSEGSTSRSSIETA